MVRILITVSPLMYREALAAAVHRHRPEFEVRMAPPKDIYKEIGRFNPHLIVRADNDGVDPALLERVPYRVEIMYTDSMNAKIALDGSIEEVSDMTINDLLRVVDKVQRLALQG